VEVKEVKDEPRKLEHLTQYHLLVLVLWPSNNPLRVELGRYRQMQRPEGGRPLTVYEHRPPMMEVVCLRDLTELFQFDDPPSTPFGSRERQRSLP
jgi:hypothetical protein